MEKSSIFFYPTPDQKFAAARQSTESRVNSLLRTLQPGQQIIVTRCGTEDDCEFSVEFKQPC
jgi:hypothetical protein